MSRIDLTGQKFNRLQVIKFSHTGSAKNAHWRCVCDCGKTTTVNSNKLRRGQTRSCGCLRRESVAENLGGKVTHGMHKSPEYYAWGGMIQRCTNPKAKYYNDYGGRGIDVCERWRKFENFFADVGFRPAPGLTLDRIENNKNYEPGNVRWATRSTQQRNRRKTQAIQNFTSKELLDEVKRRGLAV